MAGRSIAPPCPAYELGVARGLESSQFVAAVRSGQASWGAEEAGDQRRRTALLPLEGLFSIEIPERPHWFTYSYMVIYYYKSM